jgi:hypothetical protein
LVALEAAANAADVPVTRLGVASGDRLRVKDLLDVALADATEAWHTCLPAALGQGTMQ